MNVDRIKIGNTYRMRGRKSDRRVIDILSRPNMDKAGKYLGEYQMAVCEIIGPRPTLRTVKEYLPWFAEDAIMVVSSSLPPSHGEGK